MKKYLCQNQPPIIIASEPYIGTLRSAIQDFNGKYRPPRAHELLFIVASALKNPTDNELFENITYLSKRGGEVFLTGTHVGSKVVNSQKGWYSQYLPDTIFFDEKCKQLHPANVNERDFIRSMLKDENKSDYSEQVESANRLINNLGRKMLYGSPTNQSDEKSQHTIVALRGSPSAFHIGTLTELNKKGIVLKLLCNNN